MVLRHHASRVATKHPKTGNSRNVTKHFKIDFVQGLFSCVSRFRVFRARSVVTSRSPVVRRRSFPYDTELTREHRETNHGDTETQSFSCTRNSLCLRVSVADGSPSSPSPLCR